MSVGFFRFNHQEIGEMPEPEEKQPVTEMVAKPAEQENAPETVTLSKADFEKMQKALKDANNEAAKRRLELEEKKKAEMTEVERLKTEKEDALRELAALKTNETKRKIAAEFKLPDALALRLQGKDEDELREDAKTLAATLPKATVQNPGATNPGAGGSTTETRDQKRARLLGTSSTNPLEGGGIVWKPPFLQEP